MEEITQKEYFICLCSKASNYSSMPNFLTWHSKLFRILSYLLLSRYLLFSKHSLHSCQCELFNTLCLFLQAFTFIVTSALNIFINQVDVSSFRDQDMWMLPPLLIIPLLSILSQHSSYLHCSRDSVSSVTCLDAMENANDKVHFPKMIMSTHMPFHILFFQCDPDSPPGRSEGLEGHL